MTRGDFATRRYRRRSTVGYWDISRRAASVRRGRVRDAAQQPAEDKMVNRAEEIPVGKAHVSGGVEHGRLVDVRSPVVIRRNLELQPQASWDLHFRREAEEAVPLDPFHPPEVDRVTDAEVHLVAAPPAQPHAAP
jgi:hypothetical protein